MSDVRRYLAGRPLHEQTTAPVSRCADCRHWQEDRQAVERSVAGLAVFGSAFGATIGASRLCRLHDGWVSPQDACGRFSRRG